ncbi:chaperone modulator CbpM [Parafilimonas sp.]|uniref:chaperone modulator CbpM n=1 Tax=Parafilimonas sp. TaxID=1969739 RepID=UPI003F819948
MENKNLVPAMVCCEHYKIELSFIHSLEQYGFIKTVRVDADEFLEEDELQTLEKFIRMHYELDINMQGIEAINFLLERVHNMKNEIAHLRSRLNVYETKSFHDDL